MYMQLWAEHNNLEDLPLIIHIQFCVWMYTYMYIA